MKHHDNNTLADGDPDPSFGKDGIVELDHLDPPFYETPTITMLPGGKLLLCGAVEKDNSRWFAVRCLNPDGSVDVGFPPIIDTFHKDFPSSGGKAYVQEDDKILVIGHVFRREGSDDIYYLAAARFNANGSIDEGFGDESKSVFLDLPLGSGPIDPTRARTTPSVFSDNSGVIADCSHRDMRFLWE
jgi:uncharacterized delta-60 repeat protein